MITSVTYLKQNIPPGVEIIGHQLYYDPKQSVILVEVFFEQPEERAEAGASPEAEASEA